MILIAHKDILEITFARGSPVLALTNVPFLAEGIGAMG